MKRTSKLLIIMTITSLIILSLSLFANAKVYSGSDGNITWMVDLNNSYMEISGQGEMPDYDNYESSPYSEFIPIIRTLKVNDGITSVGKCSFMYASNLKSVSLPDSLASVGEGAFEFCISLTEINLPSGVKEIGKEAFSSCRALSSIELPESLTFLGEYAFSQCISLTSINVPKNLNVIENGVFTGCHSLSQINGLENVTEIGNGAFYGCNKLKIADFPPNVLRIASRAFFGCASLDCLVPQQTTFVEGAFFGTDISLNVVWENGDKEEITQVKLGQIPSYNGVPKKDSVIDGIYTFKEWNSPLVPATTSVNRYCAVYSLATPITGTSFTQDETSVNITAELDLSSVKTDKVYIMFASYTQDGGMISCKRTEVNKDDVSATASLLLRNRTLSYVKVFIYSDPSFITPLGESVTATV